MYECVAHKVVRQVIVLMNKSGVWLPALTHKQISKTRVGKEGKTSFLKGCTIWENGRFPGSRLISSGKPRQSPSVPKKTKT